MAAYAALVSLMSNTKQMKNHPIISTYFHNKEMESLEQKAGFLLAFIQSYNSHGGIRIKESSRIMVIEVGLLSLLRYKKWVIIVCLVALGRSF